jgi:hypothetical protein
LRTRTKILALLCVPLLIAGYATPASATPAKSTCFDKTSRTATERKQKTTQLLIEKRKKGFTADQIAAELQKCGIERRSRPVRTVSPLDSVNSDVNVDAPEIFLDGQYNIWTVYSFWQWPRLGPVEDELGWFCRLP